MGKRLTIYVMTYNRPDYLAEGLASIRNQTFTDFRVAVLDNASTRSYEETLKQYSDLDIEYVRHPQNIGSMGNFRYAWSRTTDTEYMMVFHDDDLMHPHLLAEEIAVLESDKSLLWVATGMKGFRGTPPPWTSEGPRATRQTFDSVGLATALIRGASLNFGSAMYRSAARNLVDLDSLVARLSIVADRPLLLGLAEKGRCALIDAPLVYYRHHPEQDSRTGPINEDNIIELFDAYRAALRADWSSTNQRLFYSMSGFGLPDSFWRLPRERKTTIVLFLKKAAARGIFRPSSLGYYPIGLAKRQFQRAFRIPAKIQEWFRNRSKNSHG